ncbi:MAG: ERF family protein [Staphylococcus rostri]|uniref:ERF family protein n=1 Tax=Staphylococcus rostri TaxID=522262 RepID=UPI0026DFC7B7|nr:ERF family protein [Staphylococcus rostri]MDO5375721.1 ERF family protein [Staphylococcus rostri]
MAEKLNLYQKIADVKANIEGFAKDTKGFNYSYVSGSQVLHRIRSKMIEHNLLLVPKTMNENYKQIEVKKFNKKVNREVVTTEFVVEMELVYQWIDADNPNDQLECHFYAVGQQDDVSKAHGTALTYAERYFLMKFFNIPTDEDDADAKQKREQYTKPDSKSVALLEQEILKFCELMKSQGNNVTSENVHKELGINDVKSLTNAQITNAINTLQKWSNS